MSSKRFEFNNRRAFLAGSAALLATPALAQVPAGQAERDPTQSVRRNVSSFRTLDWQPYFDNLKNGAILVDIDSRAVHYWNEDRSVYKLYPSSVPLTDDLTRRGRTSVVQRSKAPAGAPRPR